MDRGTLFLSLAILGSLAAGTAEAQYRRPFPLFNGRGQASQTPVRDDTEGQPKEPLTDDDPDEDQRPAKRSASSKTMPSPRRSSTLDELDNEPPPGMKVPLGNPSKVRKAKPTATRVDPPPVYIDPETPETPESEPLEAAPPATATDADLPVEEKLERLEQKLRACVGYHSRRLENVAERTPWDVMHFALPYGVDSQVLIQGKKVNTLSWLCINGECRGQRLLKGSNGELSTRVGRGVQGLAGQFLAVLAQSQVSGRYPLRADGHAFKVYDLVEYEKATCETGREQCYKLIGLVHYLECDATWQNQAGETWSISRLLQEELDQPLGAGSCGGTHRLMGISYALRVRTLRSESLEGEWQRAKLFEDVAQNRAIKMQNPDGSLSTNFFEQHGDDPNLDRRLHSTGHLVEWFAFSLPREQLLDARLMRAVEYLTDLLLKHPDRAWEPGHKGHALHGLSLYLHRVYEEEADDSADLTAVLKTHEREQERETE